MRNIADIDPNLKVTARIAQEGLMWRDASEECFGVYGLYLPYIRGAEKARYRRLPDEVGLHTNDGVATLYRQTAGGRLRFNTDSEYVAIRCILDVLCHMPHMPLSGSSGFDLYITEDGVSRYFKSFIPTTSGDGYEAIIHFGTRRMRDITVNFPLYNGVAALAVGLDEKAAVSPAAYKPIAPIVYYGSSITQGGCASRPGNSYQGFITRALDIDHVNLGFSGSGKGETIMAEYIAAMNMSLFVMDYDHNAPTPEHLEHTHYPFYKVIRAARPELPIICVSRPLNPAGDDQIERRRGIIMATVERARAEGDMNIRFIDGGEFFAGEYGDGCTVDGAHPNDLGFLRMAQRMLPDIRGMLGL